MTPSQRDDIRRRERWAERHHGHHTRRNAAGAVRCLTCYRHAKRRVRLPDDGIVDEVVISRLLAGGEVPNSDRERAVAVHRMAAAGEPYNEIARRFGLSGATLGAILGEPEPVDTFDDRDEDVESELEDAAVWAMAA